MRLVNFRQDFQSVSRKLHRVVRTFIAEGGERESAGTDDQEAAKKAAANTKWNNFRKAQLDQEV